MTINEAIIQIDNGYYMSEEDIKDVVYQLETLLLKLKNYSNTE
jgi:hypothetical protein